MAIDQTKADGNRIAQQAKRHWLPIVLAIALIILIVQNTNDAQLDFLWITFDWPLWLVLLLTAAAGFVVGWFAARRRASRARQ